MDIKNIKILLFVTTTALMISLALTGSVAAAEGFKITAARVEGGAGGQVTVNITAENATGSEGGQFNLTFDQNVVKPVLIEPGDLVLSAASNLHMANLDFTPGELIFMWVTANADTKDSGVVCKVTFDLLKEGISAIDFKDLIIVAEFGDAAVSTAGQIKIGPEAAGGGTVSDPDQETETDAGDPESGEDDPGEEVIGEGDGEEETENITEQGSISSTLVIVPILIIVVLFIIYYLMKKSGKKTTKRKI